MNYLACDLGGTKVLLGIFERVINDDSPKLLFKKKYISSDWDSFELILEDFLKNECKNITHPSSACFAVAGPLSNNKAKIINLSWNISGNALQNKFNFKSCELINNNGYRSKVDTRNEKIGYKIREATLGRVPLIAVIGDKEEEINSVAIRALDGTNL